jgi:hypothetical protein
MGTASSTFHEILGEHKLLGDINMFGTSHNYVSMKKADIADLLSKHITSGDIYYIATNTSHKYDICIAFCDGKVERSMVINIEDSCPDPTHPETTAADMLRKALPDKHPGWYALLESLVKGILVLVDVNKVQRYAPVIEWGPGGITCTLTLEYNWSMPRSAHKIVIDAWDEPYIIELMNHYNSALLHKHDQEVVGWNPVI